MIQRKQKKNEEARLLEAYFVKFAEMIPLRQIHLV